jgi:hypothetical protein
MNDDEDFGDGTVDEMAEANSRQLALKMANDGFRIEKAKEEERLMQVGFDEGFGLGIALGKACGSLFGKVKVTHGSCTDVGKAVALKRLEVLLFNTLPESPENVSSIVNEIEAQVCCISESLAPDVIIFRTLVSNLPSY